VPARRSPLISVTELHEVLGEPHVRVADVRWYLGRPEDGRAAYANGHIPGAVFVDLDADLADHNGYGAPGRHPLPSPHAFALRMGELGFGSDDLIVCYDDSVGAIAARLWWMLDNLRHRGGVAVLDGGIQSWIAAGYEITTDEPHLPEARIELASDWSNVIEREELARRLGTLTIVDARAAQRYRGEVEPVDPVAGHIPTAVNVPLTNNLDSSGKFKSPAQLRIDYGDVVRDGTPTVLQCGSGTTACHGIIAMRLAGLPEPLLYVGSYSDWSRTGMPVETGSEPGSPPGTAAAS
jgi:thiosulfate/3-mercaptopyruvate sulfurtransferase